MTLDCVKRTVKLGQEQGISAGKAWKELAAAGRIASTARKLSKVNSGDAQLDFSYLSDLGPQPIEWCCPWVG